MSNHYTDYWNLIYGWFSGKLDIPAKQGLYFISSHTGIHTVT